MKIKKRLAMPALLSLLLLLWGCGQNTPMVRLSTTSISLTTGQDGGVITRVVQVSNLTSQNLNFSATSNAPWLSATPNSGTLFANTTRNLTVNIGPCTAIESRSGLLTLANGFGSVSIAVNQTCTYPQKVFEKRFNLDTLDSIRDLKSKDNTLYAVGRIGSTLESTRVLLLKFDLEGNIILNRQFSSGAAAVGYGVALDSQNNIIIAGVANRTNFFTAGADFLLMKVDGAGNPLWSKNWATGNSLLWDVAVDAQDNIYTVGFTNTSVVAPNKGQSDIVVYKFDPSGNTLWAKQFGTPAKDGESDSQTQGISVDGQGNVIVSSTTGGDLFGSLQGGSDGVLFKLDPSGNLLWSVQQAGNGNEACGRVALDGAGNVYQACHDGDVMLRKSSPNGALLFETKVPGDNENFAYGLAVDNAGFAYLGGSTLGQMFMPVSKNDAFVAKLAPSGELLWGSQLNNPDYDSAFGLVLTNGNLFVAGGVLPNNQNPPDDTLIAKYRLQ